jgi:hypothetical protein
MPSTKTVRTSETPVRGRQLQVVAGDALVDAEEAECPVILLAQVGLDGLGPVRLIRRGDPEV